MREEFEGFLSEVEVISEPGLTDPAYREQRKYATR